MVSQVGKRETKREQRDELKHFGKRLVVTRPTRGPETMIAVTSGHGGGRDSLLLSRSQQESRTFNVFALGNNTDRLRHASRSFFQSLVDFTNRKNPLPANTPNR